MDDSMLDQLLAELAPLFCDEDDNPLPEMGICGVPPGAANAIWQRLLLDARIVPADATVFLTSEGRDAAYA